MKVKTKTSKLSKSYSLRISDKMLENINEYENAYNNGEKNVPFNVLLREFISNLNSETRIKKEVAVKRTKIHVEPTPQVEKPVSNTQRDRNGLNWTRVIE